MSELAKEKLYRKELIEAGATGNNNLERIRSLAGGGGSSDKPFFMEELSVKLPKKLRYIQVCGNEECIYLCGGVDDEDSATEDIYEFNLKTKEIVLKASNLNIISAKAVYAYGRIWLFGGYEASGIQNGYVYTINTENFDIASVNFTPVVLGNNPLVTHKGNAFYIFTPNKMYRLVVDETNLVGNELEEIGELSNYRTEYGEIFQTNECNYSIFTVGGGNGVQIDKKKKDWGMKLDENGTPTLEITYTEDFPIEDTKPYRVAWGKQNENYTMVDFDHKTYCNYKCNKITSGTIIGEVIPLDSSNSKIKSEISSLQSFSTVSTSNGIYIIGGAIGTEYNVDTIFKITLN